MMNLYKYFLNYQSLFYGIIGSIIIYYFFNFRIFKSKIPKELRQDLFADGHYMLIIGLLLTIALFVYLIIVNLKTIFNKEIKMKFTILLQINVLYNKSLKTFDDFIINNTFISNYIGEWTEALGLFLFHRFNTKIRKIALMVLVYVLPKYLILFGFMVDVFIFKEFFYIYLFSPLVLVKFVFDYLFYQISDFCNINIEAIDEILIIRNTNTFQRVSTMQVILHYCGLENHLENHFIAIELTPEFLDKFKNERFSVTDTINTYKNFLYNNLMLIKNFEITFRCYYKETYLPYFNVILYIVYSFIWLYILIYSF